MKKTFQSTLRIEGFGISKELAINTALGTIQKKVMEQYKGIILRIEPIDIRIISANETIYTERFLFFLFPRKRKKYKVVLDIDVNIFMLNVDEIPFESAELPDNIRNVVLGNEIK